MKPLKMRQGNTVYGIEPAQVSGKVILTKEIDDVGPVIPPLVIDINVLDSLTRWVQLQRKIHEMEGLYNG